MKKLYSPIIAFLLIVASNNSLADIKAITVNGKSVLLKDDNTWQYAETKKSDHRYAHLAVANIQRGDNYCSVGFKLHNDLADYITSIVFKFSAHNKEDVRYDTITKGFQHLKPTNERYQEITFGGISCKEIKYIRVHGGDRCEIGKLTKHSAEKGECLKMVAVEPSKKIVIFKRYHDEPQSETDEGPESEDDMETMPEMDDELEGLL